jgi:hypothetical protein
MEDKEQRERDMKFKELTKDISFGGGIFRIEVVVIALVYLVFYLLYSWLKSIYYSLH